MIFARDLQPGDVYRTADGVAHTVVQANHLSHRTTVFHDDDTVRVLFPNVRVTLVDPEAGE